ncbi:hypothetical protein GQ55_4G054200, partial [Panicum hallii var. hallii]
MGMTGQAAVHFTALAGVRRRRRRLGDPALARGREALAEAAEKMERRRRRFDGCGWREESTTTTVNSAHAIFGGNRPGRPIGMSRHAQDPFRRSCLDCPTRRRSRLVSFSRLIVLPLAAVRVRTCSLSDRRCPFVALNGN